MVAIKKQKGVVLIIALVFLISLTAVASALMLNTTTDIKMSGASEEKLVATQTAISAIDETIAMQLRGATNFFAGTNFPMPVVPVNAVVTDVTITNPNNNDLTVTCPHAKLATSGLQCVVLRVTANNNYGRKNASNIQVEAGIAQQVFPVGN